MVFKIVLLVIMALCALVAISIPLLVPEVNDKNKKLTRTKIIVRVRMGCFLTILIALLLCIIF